jgi:hypothetical protein
MGAGSVAKFLTNLGKKAFSEVDEFIGTAVKNAGQEIDEGLRYMQDQGALGDLLNRYYSNMNRGSKLTTRGPDARYRSGAVESQCWPRSAPRNWPHSY